MNDFFRVLLSSKEEGLVKSYMESHELSIEFMTEIVKSQHCEMFLKYVHSKLYNQQEEASAPVADVTNIHPGLTEGDASSTLDKFLFQKIDVKILFCDRMSASAENMLRRVEQILFSKDILYWGQLFTENAKLIKVLSQDEYHVLSANVERCFGRKVYDLSYIKSVLTPMLSDYSQKKAEQEKKEKDAELIAEKERLQMEPISKVFGVTSCYYQKLSRSGKCRMTRILKKVGEKSLTELRSLTQEELYAVLGNSDELLETLQMCMQACA
jgi:hypothetical protein